MNTHVRYVSAVALLGACLVFAGCNTKSSQAPRPRVVEEFAVVESSTDKELTSAQLAELHTAVSRYLKQQGLVDNRFYYVKVTFPQANPGEPEQWAIVRVGTTTARTYQVLAAYPGPDDRYPYDYHYYRAGYSTGYFPGYAGFSNWGYYDPYDYNYGYYSGPYQPVPPRDHNKPDRPDRPDYPPAARNRWEHTPRGDSDQPRNYPPRTANPERWARDRADHDRGSGGRTREREDRPERSSPPPRQETSYSPPERSYSPSPTPTHSEPIPSRTESSSSNGIQQSATVERAN